MANQRTGTFILEDFLVRPPNLVCTLLDPERRREGSLWFCSAMAPVTEVGARASVAV